jgi:hypothetical protein
MLLCNDFFYEGKSEHAFSIFCVYVGMWCMVCRYRISLQNVYEVLFVLTSCKIFRRSESLRLCLKMNVTLTKRRNIFKLFK